jgi:hypothetical protein
MPNNLDPTWAGVVALAGLLLFAIIMAIVISFRQKKLIPHAKS